MPTLYLYHPAVKLVEFAIARFPDSFKLFSLITRMGGLCSRCFRSGSSSGAFSLAPNEIELSSFVHIDPALCGKDIRVNGDVVSGTGCAIANCALHQTRSYFEITIKTSGTFFFFCALPSKRSRHVISYMRVLLCMHNITLFNICFTMPH